MQPLAKMANTELPFREKNQMFPTQGQSTKIYFTQVLSGVLKLYFTFSYQYTFKPSFTTGQKYLCCISNNDKHVLLLRKTRKPVYMDLPEQVITNFCICVPLWQNICQTVTEGFPNICFAHLLSAQPLLKKSTHHALDFPVKSHVNYIWTHSQKGRGICMYVHLPGNN